MLSIVVAAACKLGGEFPIRIGTIVWPGYEALYLARGLGYFEGVPVKMVEFGNTPEALRAFKNRAIEAVAITGDEFVRLAETHPDIRAVLVFDFSHGGDVLLAAEGIQKASDLKGKRIGFEPDAVSMYFLNRFLERHSIQRESVELVPIPLEQHEQTLLNLEVEAVVTFEPQATRLSQSGANRLFDSSSIPGEIFDVLAVREELIRDRPGDLVAILSAYFKALGFIANRPDEAAERMARRVGVSPETMSLILGRIQILDERQNQSLLGEGGGLAAKLGFVEQNMQRWRWIGRAGASNLVSRAPVEGALQ